MWLVEILLFLTLSSLIACSSVQICSSKGSDNSSKTIIDLNDDCLYETLKLLDLEDLNNLAESNSRFKPLALSMFIKKGFEALENFRTVAIHFSMVNEPKLASKIVKEFMPKSTQTDSRSFKLVFLLKSITFFYHRYHKAWMGDQLKLNGLNQFTDEIIDENISIGQYTKILTLYDHYQLLSYFHETLRDDELLIHKEHFGFLSFAYMLVLDQSEHLDKQFNYGMMLDMNKVRNAANAYYLFQTNKNSSESDFGYHEKFKLNFDLYKGDVSAENVKNQFRLALAKDEVNKLFRIYSKYSVKLEVYLGRAYCAIRSLSGPNFIELVDATNLNIALFDLSKSIWIVGKMHKSLLKECVGAKAIESDLQKQLSTIDKLVGGQGSVKDYKYLINRYSYSLPRYLRKLEAYILAKANEWIIAPNVTEYIELLRTCVKIDQFNIHQKIKGTIDRLHFVYYHFVNHSHVFDNFEQLNEIDRLINQLTEDRESHFFLGIPSEFGPLLRPTLNHFDSLMTSTGNDSRELYTRQRIALKFLLITACGSLDLHRSVIEEIASYFARIVEYFNVLADLDAENIIEDKYLLRYWDRLYDYVQYISTWSQESEARAIFARIFRLAEQPYNLSGNPAKDVLMYIYYLTVAKYMDAYDKTLPTQTLDNILLLEESVGDAITFEDFVRDHVAKAKSSFYYRFGDAVRRRQEKADLKRYVDSMIERFFDPSKYYTTEQYEILNSTFVAVQNVGENAKALIGNELIATLGDISYDAFYLSRIERDQFTKNVYDNVNKILNFKESLKVIWKY